MFVVIEFFLVLENIKFGLLEKSLLPKNIWKKVLASTTFNWQFYNITSRMQFLEVLLVLAWMLFNMGGWWISYHFVLILLLANA